ncbi:MAG: type II toxin-antitoxin system PemK/MazF family toxin [candidate division KSB1 bacterium]|nr:type II toxin-antitoxin system PemK/MazF family toxin [candidate division KSB1 bacterium]MDZ7303127.1 type II toxin-antitoxin system PemK/MazF family toxin [candidate division KSB1 bacterium]MDZ7310108.1 type II toxin-antitoxin system PemK/MazF family toxin [candidate division KSB1 bacterium]
MMARRFEVYLVNLDPTQGKEIKKTRPCLIISPDEMNRFIATVIVAPMTTKGRDYPSRVFCRFKGKDGQVVLDQIRTVDKSRLIEKLGTIDRKTQTKVLAVLGEMFAP